MLIKRKTNGRSAGYLWTDEADPRWMRFSYNPETSIITGIAFSRVGGTIPRATPFKYRLQNQNVPFEDVEAHAVLILAEHNREVVYEMGKFDNKNSETDKLANWEAFLSGKEETREKKGKLTEFELPRERYESVANVGRPTKGAVRLASRHRLEFGSPLSGFDAYKGVSDPKIPFKRPALVGFDLTKAKTALQHVSRPTSLAVAWYAKAPKEVEKYRMQAAQAMPVLAGLIAESPSISKAVDNIEAFVPILMERTGLTKASMKRIGKLRRAAPVSPIFDVGEETAGEDALGVNRVRRFSITGSVSVDRAMRYLADLPPDRTPSSDEEWSAFNDILAGCAIPLANTFDLEVKDILAASKGNWVEYKKTLARAADVEFEKFDRRVMALTAVDAIEAIDHFARTAVLPQALASVEETEQPLPFISGEYVNSGLNIAAKLVIGNAKNVAANLFEVARRYAGRIPELMQIAGTEAPRKIERFDKYSDGTYPLLTPTFQASNGLILWPMPNEAALEDEGRRMRHCVGGYGRSARQINCHLYSVRNADGSKSHSTMELQGIQGENARHAAANLSVRQHRATRNGTPSEEATAAADEFINAVKSGEVQINYNEIMDWREHLRVTKQADGPRETPVATWASVLEVPWSDADVRGALWEEWRYVMGGKIGKSPHSGVIYSEKEARDLVGAMNPRAAAILMDQARARKEEAPTPNGP